MVVTSHTPGLQQLEGSSAGGDGTQDASEAGLPSKKLTAWLQKWMLLSDQGTFNPSLVDAWGFTPLHRCVDEMRKDISLKPIFEEILGLTARQGDLNSTTVGRQPPGCTALHLACKGRFVSPAPAQLVVQELLRAKADPVCLDPRAMTPLMFGASQVAEPQVAELLKIYTEDQMNMRNDDGRTALVASPSPESFVLSDIDPLDTVRKQHYKLIVKSCMLACLPARLPVCPQ